VSYTIDPAVAAFTVLYSVLGAALSATTGLLASLHSASVRTATQGVALLFFLITVGPMLLI